MSEVKRYTGELPITSKWSREHEGEVVAVQYRMDLEDLYTCEGGEGMNDYLDAVSGVILSDIAYRIVSATPGHAHNSGDVLIEATGFLGEL